MADYIELPLVADADALLETGISYLEEALPGFRARPGNIETVLLEAGSQIAAEVVEQAAQVDPVIFAYYGGALVGIPIIDATPATGTATVTWAIDTPAAMLPAGSQLAVPHPSGDAMLFETDTDVVSVEGGGSATVGVTAAEPGAAANDAFGDSELIDVIEGVDTVYVATTGGGTDEEDADAYLDRLADAFTILAPRPILAGDHATLARQVPGVGRALAIDLLQPPASSDGVNTPTGGDPAPWGPEPDGATGVPRCTTVAVTDEDGAAPVTALMQTVLDTLDASREVNFLNYVVPPTYTTVTVRATVTAWPGYMRQDVAAEAVDRLNEWLNPSLWGATGATDATEWTVQPVVRISEAIDYLNRAASVSWVDLSTVQLSADGGAWQSTDLTLAGLAPLPEPGVHAITVNLP